MLMSKIKKMKIYNARADGKKGRWEATSRSSFQDGEQSAMRNFYLQWVPQRSFTFAQPDPTAGMGTSKDGSHRISILSYSRTNLAKIGGAKRQSGS